MPTLSEDKIEESLQKEEGSDEESTDNHGMQHESVFPGTEIPPPVAREHRGRRFESQI